MKAPDEMLMAFVDGELDEWAAINADPVIREFLGGPLTRELRNVRGLLIDTHYGDRLPDGNAGIVDRMYAAFESGCDLVAASRFMPGGVSSNFRFGISPIVVTSTSRSRISSRAASGLLA